MNTQLINFAFEDSLVRVTDQSGNPWFVASDVCRILEIKHTPNALSSLEADERGTVVISDSTSPKGGNPNMNIISEAGLYRLIFKSRTPAAKAFQKWVMSDLLPTLRKTGTYSTRRTADAIWDDVNQLIALGAKPERAYAVVSKAQTRAAKPAKPTPEPIQFFQILEDSNLWTEPQHHIKALRTWMGKHGPKTPAWLGSVDKLAATLLKSSNPARQEAQTLLKAVPLITILRTLAQSHPDRIQTGRIRSERFWVITAPQE